ncbi:hypothetical protein [Staphylococcus phage LY01]|nr:hypothetical protein [Staphylococcus phage LY01]
MSKDLDKLDDVLDKIYSQQSMDVNHYGHVGFVNKDVNEVKEKFDKLYNELNFNEKSAMKERLSDVYNGIYNLGSIAPASHSHYKELDEEAINRRQHGNIQITDTKTYEQELMDRLDEIRNKKITSKNRERYTVEVSAILYLTICKFIPEFTKDDIINAYFDVKEMKIEKDKILGNDDNIRYFSSIFYRAIWFLRGNVEEKFLPTTYSIHSIESNFLIKDYDLEVF